MITLLGKLHSFSFNDSKGKTNSEEFSNNPFFSKNKTSKINYRYTYCWSVYVFMKKKKSKMFNQ